MKNRKIIDRWTKGQKFERRSIALSTDGSTLWSYSLKIGYTNKKGKKVVVDYTAKGGWFKSQTTSTHVNMAMAEADLVRNPIIDDEECPIEIPVSAYDPSAFNKDS